MNHFKTGGGVLTERMRRVRDRVYQVSELCSERARLVTESYRETEGLPQTLRAARAFERVLLHGSISLEPEELLVGNLARNPSATPVYPEFGVGFIEDELDRFADRPFDRFLVSDETKRELREIIPYWRERCREERLVRLASTILPRLAGDAWDPASFGIRPVIYAGYRKVSGGSSHTALDYAGLLERGFGGILGEAERYLNAVDFSEREAVARSSFLQAAIISIRAVQQYLERCAAAAGAAAAEHVEAERRSELERMSGNCLRLAHHPPETFWEALQLVWTAHLLRWVESNGHSVTIGRLDQLLAPYYDAGLRDGSLTRERALELLGHFFIKVAQIKKIRPWSETVYKSGSPTFQAITVGGVDANGRDVTNELSYLILEATGGLRLPEPVIICRVHDAAPQEFLLQGIEALIRHGGGLPSFFSDEAVIPAMVRSGIPLEKARGYAMIACSEPAVPGEHIDNTGASVYLNLAKMLELALHGGRDPLSGLCLCPAERTLSTFRSYEEVWEAFRTQLDYYMGFVPVLTSLTSSLDPELNPTPYASSLLHHRLELGRDMTEGGGPNDNNTIVQGHGLPNAANSLAAIKRLVFEEGRISADELQAALESDFDGGRGEEIRRMLLAAPKFGNDDDAVDAIAVDLAELFVEELERRGVPWRGGCYGASLQGLTANVPEGQLTGATPDGRVAGSALADNVSPQAGTDVSGVTAMLKSIGKIDHSLFLNGTILNVKIHPSALRGEGIQKLAALIQTYLLDFRGFQMQFNVVSARELRVAQENPDEHRSLLVKVAGYSAQFISLDRELQEQIILRTENTV